MGLELFTTIASAVFDMFPSCVLLVWTSFSPWSCWLLVFALSGKRKRNVLCPSVGLCLAAMPLPSVGPTLLAVVFLPCCFPALLLGCVWPSDVLRLGLLLYTCFAAPFVFPFSLVLFSWTWGHNWVSPGFMSWHIMFFSVPPQPCPAFMGRVCVRVRNIWKDVKLLIAGGQGLQWWPCLTKLFTGGEAWPDQSCVPANQVHGDETMLRLSSFSFCVGKLLAPSHEEWKHICMKTLSLSVSYFAKVCVWPLVSSGTKLKTNWILARNPQWQNIIRTSSCVDSKRIDIILAKSEQNKYQWIKNCIISWIMPILEDVALIHVQTLITENWCIL